MFVENFFSIIYGHSAKVCLIFFRKSFGQLNKTAFYESRGKIWGQNIVLTKMLDVVCFFHVLLKLNGEITVFLSKKQSANLWHLLTMYPRTFFEEVFFEKVLFFSSLGIEQLLYVISTKFCQSRCQYCFLFVN